MSSDIRKWFMKPHDKNAGAAKPSGTGTGAAAAKKPVLSIPEKPAPSSVSGSQDASARRKTSKYFAPKTEKDSDVTDKSLPKRKLHKSSDQLEDDSKPLAANRVLKDEEDDDDDFVAPSKRKTPVKPPPSKKLKAASNDDDEDERMDEDAKTPSKAAGRGRGRGRGGRGAVHAKTATPDDDVGGGEGRMDEDAKTPSKSTGRGRGRGRGGRGGGTAHGKTTGLDDDGEEDRMDEDDKTPSKAAGRGRGGRGAGSTPGTPRASSSPLRAQALLCSPSTSTTFRGLRAPASAFGVAPAPRRRAASTGIVCGKVSKGSVPPNFTLKDQDGKTVSLSKFKGKPVVLYFYPADETPGCTKQACAFRDSYEKYKKAGAEVIGISGDDAASHKAFAKKYRLPFTLLSDEGNKVRKEWGVPSDLFGTLPGRQTYVLDKKGVVQYIYNNQFQPEKHIGETLKIIQNL